MTNAKITESVPIASEITPNIIFLFKRKFSLTMGVRANKHRRQFLATAGLAVSSLGGCLKRLDRFGRSAHIDPDLQATDLFVSGEQGYTLYRIPSLVTTPSGTLLAFCEGRREGPDRGPTDVLLKRSPDGGRTWTDQQVVYSEGDLTISNPTPVVDRSTGIIYLPLIREYRDVLMTRSNDDGRSWKEPVEITSNVKRKDWGYYATGPGVGIQLERGQYAGRLVIPATHWTHLWEGDLPSDNVQYDHVIYSDDGGKSWELGGTVAPNVDEPQAVELPDGRVMFNMRNHWSKAGDRPEAQNVRAVATSDDGGRSWSAVTFDRTLKTPTCQASLIRYSWPDEGRSRLLFSNPADTDNRVDMTVRLSYDEGTSWAHNKLLDSGRAAYSCLTRLPDGSIGCLYERGSAVGKQYQRLIFCRFTLDWLTDGADTGPAP